MMWWVCPKCWVAWDRVTWDLSAGHPPPDCPNCRVACEAIRAPSK